MKFKKGDKVKIKSEGQIADILGARRGSHNISGTVAFTDEMWDWCDSVVEVTLVDPDDSTYNIENDFWWKEEWICEPINPITLPEDLFIL